MQGATGLEESRLRGLAGLFAKGLFRASLPASAEESAPRVTVACGRNTEASCPAFAEDCFDFSPNYCRGPKDSPSSSPPAWKSPRQSPAVLWQDAAFPSRHSSLSVDAQICINESCDALEPAQASRCYCLGKADDPRLCDPPLGLAQAMATVARASCVATFDIA